MNQGQILGDIHIDRTISKTIAQFFQGGANHVLDITGFSLNVHGTGFQTGHIQQVAHQPVEPVGFLAGSLDQAVTGGIDPE